MAIISLSVCHSYNTGHHPLALAATTKRQSTDSATNQTTNRLDLHSHSCCPVPATEGGCPALPRAHGPAQPPNHSLLQEEKQPAAAVVLVAGCCRLVLLLLSVVLLLLKLLLRPATAATVATMMLQLALLPNPRRASGCCNAKLPWKGATPAGLLYCCY